MGWHRLVQLCTENSLPKSGYLPDISGTFQRWRQYYLDGLSMGVWSQVAMGLHNMNGSLSEEYRLVISDEMWQEQSDSYIVWECQHCTSDESIIVNEGEDNQRKEIIQVQTKSKKEDILIYNEYSTEVVLLLSGQQERRMWECPKCHVPQSVDAVETLMMKHAEPHYRDCIYAEPIRPLTGLMRRRGSYPESMKNWAKSYSLELEHKLALYRLEYIKQHEGEDMDFAHQEKGD